MIIVCSTDRVCQRIIIIIVIVVVHVTIVFIRHDIYIIGIRTMQEPTHNNSTIIINSNTNTGDIKSMLYLWKAVQLRSA